MAGEPCFEFRASPAKPDVQPSRKQGISSKVRFLQCDRIHDAGRFQRRASSAESISSHGLEPPKVDFGDSVSTAAVLNGRASVDSRDLPSTDCVVIGFLSALDATDFLNVNHLTTAHSMQTTDAGFRVWL